MMDHAIQRLQGSTMKEDLLQKTVEEVKKITEYDRVMIYQFDENYNGQVVAEAREDSLEMKDIDFILVEDSEVDGQLLKRIIKKEDLTDNYVWMKDGSQILDYLKDEKSAMPTAILLDIKLPKVNGLDVLKVIRSSERTKNIPVVMYSSSEMKDDIQNAYQYGANSYLTKPNGFKEMKEQFVNFFNYWVKHNRSALKFKD